MKIDTQRKERAGALMHAKELLREISDCIE
jgi:hypothetical protein